MIDVLETILVIFAICSPISVMGIVLFLAVRSGSVPSWLNWWVPMTKNMLSYHIDERYTKSEKIQIDGLVFAAFGNLFAVWLSLFYVLVGALNLIGEKTGVILFLILLALSKRIIELIGVVILKRLRILKN